MRMLTLTTIGALAGVALLTAGCAKEPGAPSAIPAPPAVATVQSYAENLCGFVPLAGFVLDLFASSATSDSVEGWGNLICSAVTRKSARRGAPMAVAVRTHSGAVKMIPVRGYKTR